VNRLLLKYAKSGEAALLSHRETMRSLERAIRRSGLPLVFTAGYSPRLRMSFSPALPLGVAARAEYVELTIEESPADLECVRGAINNALPLGLAVLAIQELPPGMPKLSKWTRLGLYRLEAEDADIFLLLSLTGPKQGKLKDALTALAELSGGPESRLSDICRLGLYASEDEVFEDVGGFVYYFDGELRELVLMKNQEGKA
jgi:radical SAM-linked protein